MSARIAKAIRLFALLLLGSGISTSVCSAENRLVVALVIDADSHIHDKTVAGIKLAVNSAGHEQAHFHIIDINKPASVAAIKASAIDYAIVVGVKPALFALKQNLSYPHLYTLIPENTYREIIRQGQPASRPVTNKNHVIFLGQMPERQLALARVVMGKKSRVGLVVGDNSHAEAMALQQAATTRNIQLVMQRVSAAETVIDDIKQVLKGSDIYLALYDTNIINRHNAKWLLYMAYKMKKPVIGFSASYTRAGAVASIFSTPEQIGRQSGEWLLDMLAKKTVSHTQYPKYFTITTNPNIQRILRLERLSGEKIKTIMQRNEQAIVND
ncbi:ABC transporter substrate-binding protein [Sulfuriflexus sp.]|uniref:ABC transporter substrate-binding protein n=1 Tax=Sulfuriflexus sp. TaxID=2015443 RepID=UPI0028CBCC01|nr:ABC transporter substrate binding protein [Sulfuriflexus sp.]MDT8404224.1 ABC transporter substrate binding protein [Sulfuriflexus sp.]